MKTTNKQRVAQIEAERAYNRLTAASALGRAALALTGTFGDFDDVHPVAYPFNIIYHEAGARIAITGRA